MRLLPVLFVTLCASLQSCSPGVHGLVRGSEADSVSPVAADDADMNARIVQAKATLGEFLAAFDAGKPGTRGFYVKKGYLEPGAQAEEMMWIEVNETKGDILKGTVSNEAEKTRLVKLGDDVTLKRSEVSDWKYQDGRKLVGGYTIRYFTDRMSPEERKVFCETQGFEL